jgi:hypothetical protein
MRRPSHTALIALLTANALGLLAAAPAWAQYGAGPYSDGGAWAADGGGYDDGVAATYLERRRGCNGERGAYSGRAEDFEGSARALEEPLDEWGEPAETWPDRRAYD